MARIKKTDEEIRKATGHAAITKRIKGMTDTFLDCRDPGLRHAWVRENDFHVLEVSQESTGRKRGLIFLGRTEVCGRCDTRKEERFIVGKSGVEKTGQSYIYPEGYLMPGIPRGVKPSTVIYQEQYRRATKRVAQELASRPQKVNA